MTTIRLVIPDWILALGLALLIVNAFLGLVGAILERKIQNLRAKARRLEAAHSKGVAND